ARSVSRSKHAASVTVTRGYQESMVCPWEAAARIPDALDAVDAAAPDPFSVHAFAMLSGKMIHGWPSGSAIDSEDTMQFSALTHVRPQIERFPLEAANEAFAKVMDNTIRFRAVLDMSM
ncbi:MAG: hypothetical protein WAU39_13375, partial [Polyangiales bacterium]